MAPSTPDTPSPTGRRQVDTPVRQRRRLRLLGLAPALFASAFAIRAVVPVVDVTLLAILAAMVAVIAGLLRGHRWAGAAFLIFPIALVTTPAVDDLSFSLSATDSTWWRWHAIVSLLTAGVASAVAVAIALDKPIAGRAAVAVGAGGAAIGAALLVAVPELAPNDVFGQDLTAGERAALPEVALLNYAYVPLDIDIEQGDVYQAMLVNDSDLPHTLTIDEIELDVRVPAGRSAVVEIDTTDLPPGVTQFYCAVGDHRPLGMVGRISVDG